MSKKIPKHIKVSYYCKNCERNIETSRHIVLVSLNFCITDIKAALNVSPLTKCKIHETYTENSFTFYHEEKLK